MIHTLTVTGYRGFIGSHMVEALRRRPETEVLGIEIDDTADALHDALARSEAVFHLAGVNRPEKPEDYEPGNLGFTQAICARLDELGRHPLVVFSSSTQAELDNPYGNSKRRAEEALRQWARTSGAPVALFRLPNVFGKWARPNYNSATATFCHNVARGVPLTVSDPDRELHLVYIDEVVQHMAGCLDSPPRGCELRNVDPVYDISLGDLADLIRSFRATRESLVMPDFSDGLVHRLYATYLANLDESDFAYGLHTAMDDRGALAEILKAPGFGQIFVSRTAPRVTRGNHYHHTKCEKFVVVEGEAVVRFRDIRGGSIAEYPVRGEDFRVIDIPPGYTHSIENVGKSDLVTLFWANESFDPDRPDTYNLPVIESEAGGATS